MATPLNWLLSAALGATAMYYLDPVRGRQRRALVRNQLVHASHKAAHDARVAGQDAANRMRGLAANARAALDSEQPDDDVLTDRVRACLGRIVTHPSSIHVSSADGIVTLSGPVLTAEVPGLVDCVLGVRGVREVRNALEIHDEPGRVPGLQGTPEKRTGRRAAFRNSNWPPALRFASGIGGTLATLYGLKQRSNPAGLLLGAGGMLLAARAASNLELDKLVGVGGSRRVVEVRKSIRINAPVEDVFELWEDLESFPQFMTHVRRVRRIETATHQERWRWTVSGPAGTEFEFDSVLTAREPNRMLGWRTEKGAFVQHAGRVDFHSNADGSTTVEIKLAYNPVVGAIGHTIARAFGTDPKRLMDDDLMRMKAFVETGRPPRDAAQNGGGTAWQY
jgi:uncharacterized membrane protein